MSSSIRFYFDYVCPWAYLASRQLPALARATGVDIELCPILRGGVLRSVGTPDRPAESMSAPRRALLARDLERWATRDGVVLRFPEQHPRRTVLALRATLATGDVERAMPALFEAYWRDGADLEDEAVVGRTLDALGLDGAEAVRRAATDEFRSELRRRTDAAVAAGVFGVPTFVVSGPRGEELFWGRDRVDQVRRSLARPVDVDFWFDFSSPYAYLAATQLRRIAGRTNARIHLKPVLLGALFRSIGTPDVPLFAMPAAKQRYLGQELERWARARGVPFRFSTRFPIHSVKALRLVLASPEELRFELVERLFRAAWVDDRDLSDETELAVIAGGAGVDPAVLARIMSPEIKEALRASTAEAEGREVFGVPSFDVGGERFWGQDRIEQLEEEILRQGGIREDCA
jgi:2-hydroxychromene-2-carboxylate isomerase